MTDVTLLFKSLFFEINLKCSYVLSLDIFSIITQWGFCKDVLSKKVTTLINRQNKWALSLINLHLLTETNNYYLFPKLSMHTSNLGLEH